MRRRSLVVLALSLLGCGRGHGIERGSPAPLVAPVASSAEAAPAPAVSASAAPLVDAPMPAELAEVDAAARGAIDRGEVAGAVIAVVQGGALTFERAYGLRAREPAPVPMTTDTVFDLASLTKAVATAPAIHLLVEQKKLRLGDRVARWLPAFAASDKAGITVEQLLLHTSGLPADDALGDYAGGRDHVIGRIAALPLEHAPGAAFVYSDVGYIVLGAIVERLAGERLDAFTGARFYAPLGMSDTAFLPGPSLVARAAPTEREGDRLLQGEVHDPRARRMEGVAGHAGLFSTAGDLARFSEMLLGAGELDGARVLAAATVARMTAPRRLPDGGARSPGWDVDTKFSGNRGELPGGYGHTGFTGTSLWIDPSTRSAVVVLTSRLHAPTDSGGQGDARRLRREVATALAHANRSTPAGVLTGIDVLERDGFAALRGRHIGLVTHAAAVDRRGARTLDVLRAAPGVELVAVFSPEHGLGGDRDQPIAGGGRDPHTGLLVHSLYGDHTRPSDAELTGIDTLVYDLQDVGARFYTYETTLGYLLETAASHHLRLIVLDRPNPIGGAHVEGPVLEPGRSSFVGYHPLPVRHGMSVGELATLFDAERGLGAELQVVRTEGWNRAALFDGTGLPWMNPSPNLRSLDEELLYPGVALVELTNVSVGRGTPHPFEQIGAPWIDGPQLAAALVAEGLAGVRIDATTFTPSSSSYAGELCRGVAIRVLDRDRIAPVRVGFAIARQLRRLYLAAWKGDGLLTLLGDRASFEAVMRVESLDRIEQAGREGLEAFLPVRARHLLYPSSSVDAQR